MIRETWHEPTRRYVACRIAEGKSERRGSHPRDQQVHVGLVNTAQAGLPGGDRLGGIVLERLHSCPMA
jgi:hypothetical protein